MPWGTFRVSQARPIPQGYYTVRDVAKALRVSVYSVRRWVKLGSLPAVGNGLQGRKILVAKDALEAFLATRGSLPIE